MPGAALGARALLQQGWHFRFRAPRDACFCRESEAFLENVVQDSDSS